MSCTWGRSTATAFVCSSSVSPDTKRSTSWTTNQLTAFISREANRLAVEQFDPKNRLFASIKAFLSAVDVVENELLDPSSLPEPLATTLVAYYESLERHRLLTYGQRVVRAVEELRRPELAASVNADLRHLVVDEYQERQSGPGAAHSRLYRTGRGVVRGRG